MPKPASNAMRQRKSGRRDDAKDVGAALSGTAARIWSRRDRSLREKVVTLEEAASFVQDGDAVGIGG